MDRLMGILVGANLKSRSPSPLKDRLVLSKKKYLNACFQHSLGEQPSRLGSCCDPWSSERENQTVMADV